jgi:transglutaminase-like putative cysteine protease
MAGRRAGQTAVGVWGAGRDVHRADAYHARVYVPSPRRAELEAAVPAFYPDPVLEDLTFNAESGPVGEEIEVLVRAFKERPFLVSYGAQDAVPGLRDSNLRRIYALSRRLLAGAATPYDYLQAVQRHLQDGFTYDEAPPPASRTLDGFLFDSRSGFCQQYSGAMALLLRMGGVPARVATGFAPGSYDEDAKRYVVRDLDAHSWVEAWFEGIGWVEFDPTPPSAPPRSQALAAAASAGNGDIRDRGTKQIADAPFRSPDSPWGEVALTVLGFAALGALIGGVALRRTRERVELSELERALHSAREACGPGTTLTTLEARLPAARDYLRALREERYAGGAGPTAEHRRTLRRALTQGRGPLSRGRTWLALRPRLRS